MNLPRTRCHVSKLPFLVDLHLPGEGVPAALAKCSASCLACSANHLLPPSLQAASPPKFRMLMAFLLQRCFHATRKYNGVIFFGRSNSLIEFPYLAVGIIHFRIWFPKRKHICKTKRFQSCVN